MAYEWLVILLKTTVLIMGDELVTPKSAPNNSIPLISILASPVPLVPVTFTPQLLRSLSLSQGYRQHSPSPWSTFSPPTSTRPFYFHTSLPLYITPWNPLPWQLYTPTNPSTSAGKSLSFMASLFPCGSVFFPNLVTLSNSHSLCIPPSRTFSLVSQICGVFLVKNQALSVDNIFCQNHHIHANFSEFSGYCGATVPDQQIPRHL